MHHKLHDVDSSLSSLPFWKPTIGILAIERDSEVITFPAAGAKIQHGDTLLCYSKVKEIMGLTKQSET